MTARTLPVMPTFLAGQKLTASTMNQLVTATAFWADPPTFRMYQAVAQSVANSTDTQITCDTSVWDSDTGRAVATPYSYTIPASWGNGQRWTFAFCVAFASNATGTRWAFLKQNGTAVTGTRFQVPGGSDPSAISGTCSITVNSGDTISLWGGQDSGGALNTSTATSVSFLEGWLRGLGSP